MVTYLKSKAVEQEGHSLFGKTKDAEQKVFLANKGAEQVATVLNRAKQLQRCFISLNLK
jgi:hypothetical protein